MIAPDWFSKEFKDIPDSVLPWDTERQTPRVPRREPERRQKLSPLDEAYEQCIQNLKLLAF